MNGEYTTKNEFGCRTNDEAEKSRSCYDQERPRERLSSHLNENRYSAVMIKQGNVVTLGSDSAAHSTR